MYEFVSTAQLPIVDGHSVSNGGTGAVGVTVLDKNGTVITAKNQLLIKRIFTGDVFAIYQKLITLESQYSHGVVLWDDHPTTPANAKADIFGPRHPRLEIPGYIDGTASPTSFDIDGALLSGDNNTYNGCALVFTMGALYGVVRRITSYDGVGQKSVTFATAWPSTPADGDEFLILGRLE